MGRGQGLAPPAAAAVEAPQTSPSGSSRGPFSQDEWDAFVSGYASCYEERVLPIDASMVEGTIPAELSGSYLRNGPGLLEVGGTKIPQPFDGDGMITCVTFANGKAMFRNKFVRTDAFVAEQKAGRMLFQGVFNKASPDGRLLNNPLDLEVKKVANTGVIYWAGKLLALYEGDLPYQLSSDLETLGRTGLGVAPVPVPGEKASGIGPADVIAAHYRVVVQPDGTKRWVTFGPKVDGLDNKMALYEFDEAGNAVAQTEVMLKGAAFGFFHDLMVTERHYVLIENPIQLDLLQLITGYVPKRSSFAECLRFRPDVPAKVHLIPRPGTDAPAAPGGVRTFDLPASFFSFHHINAFEEGTKVVMDTVALLEGVDFSASLDAAGPSYFTDDTVGRGYAIRLVLDTATGKVVQRKLFSRSCEFPAVNPSVVGRSHSVAYLTCDPIDHPVWFSPPQSLAKIKLPAWDLVPKEVDFEVYNPGPTRFVQEPMFVPRANGSGGEDDGWLLAYVYDGDRKGTDLVILDAAKFSQGPVATIHLPFSLPYGLHGYWSPQAVGPDPRQPPSPSSYDIREGVTAPDGSFKYA